MNPIESHLPVSGKPLDLEVSRLRKTYATDPVVIDGIVGEGPQSTMSARVFGGGYRLHIFSFGAWKIDGQDVRTGKLIVSRATPNLDDFAYQLEANSYHRVRALFSDEATRAVVVCGLVSEHCPTDLSAAAKALTVPVVISHARLGSLTFDCGLDHFSGTTEWSGVDVDVSLPGSDKGIEPLSLNRAEQIFHSENELGRQVSEFLLDSVVSELAADQRELDIQDNLFALQLLSFCDSGDVEFWYGDAGLWGGHSLVVRLDPGGEMSFSVEG